MVEDVGPEVRTMNRWYTPPLALLIIAGCSPEPVEEPAPLGVRAMLDEANAAIEAINAPDAVSLLGDTMIAFVDLREQAELDSRGTIPGSIHAPRGMLEFYIDSTSNAHMDVFTSGKRLVFYCAGGGRSALATFTAQRMGLTDVAHLAGGFNAWVEARGPIERPEPVGT
jgi:rhodanese-related sulfurtransferase